jgi:hypothetical protein
VIPCGCKGRSSSSCRAEPTRGISRRPRSRDRRSSNNCRPARLYRSPASCIDPLAHQIVNALQGPDLLALQESGTRVARLMMASRTRAPHRNPGGCRIPRSEDPRRSWVQANMPLVSRAMSRRPVSASAGAAAPPQRAPRLDPFVTDQG